MIREENGPWRGVGEAYQTGIHELRTWWNRRGYFIWVNGSGCYLAGSVAASFEGSSLPESSVRQAFLFINSMPVRWVRQASPSASVLLQIRQLG